MTRLTPGFRRSSLKRSRGRTLIQSVLLVAIGWNPQFISPEEALRSVKEDPGITQKVSDSCDRKVKSLAAFAATPAPRKKLTTRLSENEINSYLAFELKPKFNPSLRSLRFAFEENKLRAVANIDFDLLGMSSSKLLAKMVSRLLSGTHDLAVEGKLIATGGKANFQLDEARFDSSVLPSFLVEEIITAVGKKQRPPFDPMQPSQMPYEIQRVEVHSGSIVIYQ